MSSNSYALMKPCVTCPFRKGMGERFRLTPSRLREIRQASGFQCHKTVDYDDGPDDANGYTIPGRGKRPLECAGRMAVLDRIGEPDQMMRIAGRLGMFDPAKLDPDNETYATWRDVERAHRGRPPQ